MAKPPADADPEKYIIGQGVYGSLQTACAYHDGRIFRIDPGPMPTWTIITLNVIFISYAWAFYWLTSKLAHRGDGPWTFGVAVTTCTLFTAVAYVSFARSRRLGPLLIYDKLTGTVELPREGVTFQRSEIVHVQYITTKRLDGSGVLNNERLSELNLIICRDGVRQRWPLLRSMFNGKPFDRLLHAFLGNTDIPVVRVKDQIFGWRVTETPFRAVSRNA